MVGFYFICLKIWSRGCTGWVGHLFPRFCNMFSKSSSCLVGQHGSCSISQNPGELSKKQFTKPSEQVTAPPSLFPPILAISTTISLLVRQDFSEGERGRASVVTTEIVTFWKCGITTHVCRAGDSLWSRESFRKSFRVSEEEYSTTSNVLLRSHPFLEQEVYIHIYGKI